MINITQQQYDVMLRNARELYVKIDLLDFHTDITLDQIQGVAVDGSININADSSVRTSANVKFVIKDDSFLIGQDRKFWLDKKIRISVGLYDIRKNEVVWFEQGVFIINNPSVSIFEKTVSFEALDYMCMLDGTISGQLDHITEIPVGLSISESIKSAVEQISGVTRTNIEQSPFTTPYTIKKSATETVYDLVKELADLYMDWQIYFDEEGTFVFEKIRNKLANPVVWNFNETEKLLIDAEFKINFSNVANDFYIWGHLSDTGVQTKYFRQNNDVNSPFSIDKIGVRTFVVDEDKIFTYEQAEARGNYEYMLHSNLNEQLDIQCLPIYTLRANQMISYSKKGAGVDGTFLINTLSIPLSHSGSMSIATHKIYN